MLKQTQTIRREQPANCLSVFDHFVGLSRKGCIILVNMNKSTEGSGFFRIY